MTGPENLIVEETGIFVLSPFYNRTMDYGQTMQTLCLFAVYLSITLLKSQWD